MRKSRIIISLTAAASLTFNAASFEASAKSIYSGDWRYTRYYDENGDIFIDDLGYTGNDTEIFIPESFGSEPVKGLNMYSFFENDLPENGEAIKIHIPDGVEVNGMEELYYYYPDLPEIIFVDEEGNEESFKRHFSSSDLRWETKDSDWKYNILDSLEGVCDTPCVEITKYTGNDSDIVVPAILEGYPVVRLAETVFEGINTFETVNLGIPNITMPVDSNGMSDDRIFSDIRLADGCLDGMCNINVMFGFCYEYSKSNHYFEEDETYHISGDIKGNYTCNLTNLYAYQSSEPIVVRSDIAGIPVTGINESAFRVYNAFDLVLPDTITELAPYTFVNSTVRSVNIPKNVKIIPEGCFESCMELEEITGLENVRIIADNVFYKESDVRYSDEDAGYFEQLKSKWEKLINPDDMVHFNYSSELTNKNFIVTDPHTGYSYRIYKNDDNELSAELVYAPCQNPVIPDEFHGMPVKAKLKDTLPKGAKMIISEDKREISYNDIDFYHDEYLSLRKYMLDVDSGDFFERLDVDNSSQRSSIKELDIYSKDIYIKTRALAGLRFPSLEFPGSAHLGQGFCVGNFMLKKLVFSGEEPKIVFDARACEGLNYLEELVFPEKCDDLKIGMSAFGSCNIKELVIPEGTSSIGSYAFQKNGKLKSLTINGSPEVGEHSFYKCSNLYNLTISGQPVLMQDSFEECKSLENINIDMSQTFDGSAFNKCVNLKKINGKELFYEDGTLKEEYRGYIEKNFCNSDNNGIINQYTMLRVKQAVAETVDDSMTDLQKIKAIHDKICSMVNYDNDDKSNMKNHTDVSIFLHDTSVCEGYARAMNLMLHEAGVESQYVRTDDHAWVIVKVGEHYFHVDATWDDDGDTVSYDWFMKSDAQIDGKESHSDWKNDIPSELHQFQDSQLHECTSIMGDVDENGVVDAVDASAILKAYARMAVDGTITIDKVLADYNFDGKVTAVDASLVLTEYAENSVES